jgi:TPR repeat protein
MGADPEIMERQAETALSREDYAAAVSLFSAACRLKGTADCDRADEIIEAQPGLERPPHLEMILTHQLCRSGIESGCEELKAILATADKGCNAADAAACVEAGMIRLMSPASEQDRVRGVEDYRKACDLGGQRACYDYAHIVSEGSILPRDPDKAERAFRRSCDESHMHNCTLAGLFYAAPGLAMENTALARVFFEKGCGYGDEFACSNLSELDD